MNHDSKKIVKGKKMNTKRRLNTIVTLSLLLVPTIAAFADKPAITMRTNIKVRMSDGAKLATNVYLPTKGKKFATVLMRTPYNKDGMGWIAEPLANAGYAVVVQDARGQFASKGMFIPFIYEKTDGVDTLKWVARQRWCDGNIGMWGPSYLGFCALIVAPEGIPQLKTVINVAGWGDTSLMTAPGGAMHLMVALPWTLSDQISGSRSGSGITWEQAFKRTPVVDIPSIYGIDSAQWKGAVGLYSSADEDGDISISQRYEDITIPTFHISGWFDFVGPATIDAYEGIDRVARKRDGPMNKLMVGPWFHGQVYNGGTQIGDEKFPSTINVGIDKLAEMSIRWFDHWLRHKDNGIADEKPVRVFVMGENKWRTFDQWPPKTTQFELWYFSSDKGANSSTGDGQLSLVKPSHANTDQFVFDPMDPVPTNGGANSHEFPDNIGIKDQRKIEKRKDVLVYTSQKFTKDRTIIGPVQAIIYASTEGQQTDFTAKLVELRPNGYAANIVDAIKRGPDPVDGKPVQKMEPGQVYRFTLDLDATAITIKKGNRLRVEISSSNFPKYTRNPNTGEVAELATEFKKVEQTVYLSEDYPSHVLLPMLE